MFSHRYQQNNSLGWHLVGWRYLSGNYKLVTNVTRSARTTGYPSQTRANNGVAKELALNSLAVRQPVLRRPVLFQGLP